MIKAWQAGRICAVKDEIIYRYKAEIKIEMSDDAT